MKKYKVGEIVHQEVPLKNSLWIRTEIRLNEKYHLEEHTTIMICVGHMIPGSPFDLVQFCTEEEMRMEVKSKRLWSVNLRDFPVQVWQPSNDPMRPQLDLPPHFDMIIYKKADGTT